MACLVLPLQAGIVIGYSFIVEVYSMGPETMAENEIVNLCMRFGRKMRNLFLRLVFELGKVLQNVYEN